MKSKVLYILNPPLLIGTGGGTYISQLTNLIENTKVLSIENKLGINLSKKEINLNASTKFHESLFLKLDQIKLIITSIGDSETIHFNPFTFSEFIISLIALFLNKPIITTYHNNLNMKSSSFGIRAILEKWRKRTQK